MNKIICWIFLSFLFVKVSAQTFIPDTLFAQAIRWQCPECIDTSNKLTAQASRITSITLANNINNLSGLEGFSSLLSLNISDNNLTNISYLPPNLRTLRCRNNKLKTLPILPSTLSILYCDGNLLDALPVLPKNLVQLGCSRNKLYDLPELPSGLNVFDCAYNSLTLLPPLPFSLRELSCSNNRIFILNSLPKDLVLLSCFNNTNLNCLPQLPDSLRFLEISNTIKCLPNEVKKLQTFIYNGLDFEIGSKTLCENIRPNPCAVATSSADLEESVRIFPNYTEGVITIETENITLTGIAVFNNIGQLMLNIKGDTRVIDLSTLPQGIYYARVLANGKQWLKKIVKV